MTRPMVARQLVRLTSVRQPTANHHPHTPLQRRCQDLPLLPLGAGWGERCARASPGSRPLTVLLGERGPPCQAPIARTVPGRALAGSIAQALLAIASVPRSEDARGRAGATGGAGHVSVGRAAGRAPADSSLQG